MTYFHYIRFNWLTSMTPVSNGNDLLPRYHIPMIDYFHNMEFHWSTSMISNSNERLLPWYGIPVIYIHDITWKKWKYRIASRYSMKDWKKLYTDLMFRYLVHDSVDQFAGVSKFVKSFLGIPHPFLVVSESRMEDLNFVQVIFQPCLERSNAKLIWYPHPDTSVP